jgi:hypothetical protein
MDKLQQLKAAAYDLMANIEFLQAKLRETNLQIAEEHKNLQENGQSVNSNNSN